MERLIIFCILNIVVIFLSWKTLFNIRSHGFYRFLSWECIAWLVASNYRFWFANPLSLHQILSWMLLIISAYLVLAGVKLIRKASEQISGREEETLYKFEKTTELIDTGIFKFIRHPMYASLILLSWGIFLKNTTTILFVVSALSTVFMYLTATFDEKECIRYFGNTYQEYKKRSKMFIPFIF